MAADDPDTPKTPSPDDETGSLPSSGEFAGLFGDYEHPERIGPYKILQVLGEGGMGVVYLAEQTEPVHRRVALKVIKLGMDTKEVLARFEAERQALAMMNHPNIARVHDVGATEEGRSFFAMEFVQGVPITEYCDRHKLSVKERLELFLQVCQGVLHAHHKGIIHRDIKPTNILVSAPDDTPVAKIIDFGVAKATNQRLTEKTLYTEIGRTVGTPAYMSPEQAELTSEDVDHRTDIYSLGVSLYELLVGEQPLDLNVHSVAFDEIVRRIREEEPPTPSTCWSRLNVERTTKLAADRHTKPAELGSQLRRDLDWIVMKAIEKERSRRYETAAHFRDDVERYLKNEPVVARPPSAIYRLKKFTRKNRGPVMATCAVVLALTIGLVASILFALEARQNLELARDNEKEAKDNRELARKNEQTAIRRLDEVLRLSDVRNLRDYQAQADELWPACSENVDALQTWLEKARELAANLDQHRVTLKKVRDEALPYSEEDRKWDRESHPKAEELAQTEKEHQEAREELEKLERAGHSPDGVTLLSYGADPKGKHPTYYFRRTFEVKDPGALTALRARVKVDDGIVVYLNGKEILRRNLPQGEVLFSTWAPERVGGEHEYNQERVEAAGLLPGQNLLAVEVHQADPTSSDVRFDLGIEGSSEEGEAVTLLPTSSTWRFHDRGEDLKDAWRAPGYNDSGWEVARAPFGYGYKEGAGRAAELKEELANLEDKIAALEAEVSTQQTWRFEDTEDRWWHEALQGLVKGLEVFTDPDPSRGTIASVEKRLDFAKSVRDKTVAGAEAATKWEQAAARIRRSSRYGFEMTPQEGLVPLGPDASSGLEEFAHLQTGVIPERDQNGKLVLTEESGLVFVLLPGGGFHMGATRASLGVRFVEAEDKLEIEEVFDGSFAEKAGAQVGDILVSLNGEKVKTGHGLRTLLRALHSGDRVAINVLRGDERKALEATIGPNIDPQAEGNEGPVHEVTLAPFFLSKYEMTQGQWRRFKGENPSFYGPDRNFGRKQHSLLHPVEQVSWEHCNEVLSRLGLVLPTEAQWEYGCRGGTTTVWWTGSEREDLQGAANLADMFCKEHGGPATWPYEEWLDDGYTVHAPVGSYEANPFGLHDTHGNVWEWCRDWYGSYSLPVKPGDGERQVPSARARFRVYRGGCFYSSARGVRSALRDSYSPEFRYNLLGARPASGLITE